MIEYVCTMLRRTTRPLLFPYTTLFRSALDQRQHVAGGEQRAEELGWHARHGGLRQKMQEAVQAKYEKAEAQQQAGRENEFGDRKSTRLNSSHSSISYAVFCLKNRTYLT